MRKILDADIQFLSLCPMGKNGLRTLYKADDGTVRFDSITKELPDFDEKGELVACVWAPNRVDVDGDYCDASTIKTLAYSFMRNSAKVDLVHDCNQLPRDAAYIAESFIIQPSDPRFEKMTDYEGNAVDVTGGWGVVVKVNDPELRKAYREGEWQGVSMYGPAKLVEEKAMNDLTKADVSEVMAALKRLFEGEDRPQDLSLSASTNFDGDRLMVSVSEFLTTELSINKAKADQLAASFVQRTLSPKQETNPMAFTDEQKAEIAEIVKAALKPEKPEKPETPVAKSVIPDGVDFTNPAAVAAFARDAQIKSLAEATDWNDPQSVLAYNEKLSEIVKADEPKGDEEGEPTPVAPKAKKQVAKSNVRTGDTPKGDADDFDPVAAGKALAEHINKSRGYKVA